MQNCPKSSPQEQAWSTLFEPCNIFQVEADSSWQPQRGPYFRISTQWDCEDWDGSRRPHVVEHLHYGTEPGQESWREMQCSKCVAELWNGCRAQAAVYRTNRKASRCPSELKRSFLHVWNIHVRRAGRRWQTVGHWSEGRRVPALGVGGKGSITRKKFCLSSLISWCISCFTDRYPAVLSLKIWFCALPV